MLCRKSLNIFKSRSINIVRLVSQSAKTKIEKKIPRKQNKTK